MTATIELTDDLVADAVNGDGEALGAVYAVLSPKVLGYLKAHGAQDPEGLTNDVFVHVLRRLGGLVGGASGLRTFVFSVAHARLVDDVRRRARHPAEHPYEPELEGCSAGWRARRAHVVDEPGVRHGNTKARRSRLPPHQSSQSPQHVHEHVVGQSFGVLGPWALR